MDSKIYKTRTGKYAVGITKEDGYLVSTILTKKQEKELGL